MNKTSQSLIKDGFHCVWHTRALFHTLHILTQITFTDIDEEVFNSLPLEMQQEIVQQHEDATQISESGLDPEALAALPEDSKQQQSMCAFAFSLGDTD